MSLGEAIAKLFKRTPANEWAHNHPRDYRGLVWVRCTPATWDDKHATLTLRWGPYVRTVHLAFSEGMPVSLVHHKTNSDSVTLHASIRRPRSSHSGWVLRQMVDALLKTSTKVGVARRGWMLSIPPFRAQASRRGSVIYLRKY